MYGSDDRGYLSKKPDGKRRWSKARLELKKQKMMEKMQEYQDKKEENKCVYSTHYRTVQIDRDHIKCLSCGKTWTNKEFEKWGNL